MAEMREFKKRHWLVTAFLMLTILMDAYAAYTNFFGDESEIINHSNISTKFILVILGCLGIADIFFTYLLLKWNKKAFWAIIVTSTITFIINLILGIGIVVALLGFSGLLLLYGFLQIKSNQKSAWSNLE